MQTIDTIDVAVHRLLPYDLCECFGLQVVCVLSLEIQGLIPPIRSIYGFNQLFICFLDWTIFCFSLYFKMNNFKSLFNLSTQLLNNAIHSNVLLSQLRFRPRYPINRGAPRPLPYGVTRPEPNKYNWIPIYPPDGKYTTMPLKIQKLGGRDPVTGRVVVKTIGGGNKKYFRWIDYSREANPDGTPKEEKVYQIRYDPLRTTKLALIAGGMHW